MGIEQAFGLGREAEIIYVNKGADYRPYEKRIAYLEGQVEGYKMAYGRDIEELTDVARRNKILAEKKAITAELWMDTLRVLAAKGRITKDEANEIKNELEKKLTPEEKEYLYAKL